MKFIEIQVPSFLPGMVLRKRKFTPVGRDDAHHHLTQDWRNSGCLIVHPLAFGPSRLLAVELLDALVWSLQDMFGVPGCILCKDWQNPNPPHLSHERH